MILNNWNAVAIGLAEYVEQFLPHLSRGALALQLPGDAGRVVAVFGDDGYATDPRVKQEVARVRQQLQEAELEEMAFGQSQDGHAWALLVRPSPARVPDGEKIAADALTTFLDEAVWRAWRLACGIPPLEHCHV